MVAALWWLAAITRLIATVVGLTTVTIWLVSLAVAVLVLGFGMFGTLFGWAFAVVAAVTII